MVKLDNIYKIFNEDTINEKRAINNLSIHIKPNDFITVIGGNGAGKSTLLNIISGADATDAGKIVLDGTDITRWKEHKRASLIGRVFQDPMMGTATNMAIEENLAMALRRGKTRTFKWGLLSKERELYVEKLKTLDLSLETRLKVKAKLLSGGQRQAITLLMATLQKPRLLLLDEHTAALDPKTARKVLEITQKIVENDKLTTLMVTHNMLDAIKYGNRLIMMYEGKIIYDVEGEEKKALKVEDLLRKFEKIGRAHV